VRADGNRRCGVGLEPPDQDGGVCRDIGPDFAKGHRMLAPSVVDLRDEGLLNERHIRANLIE
jgi:hypothetical protein